MPICAPGRTASFRSTSDCRHHGAICRQAGIGNARGCARFNELVQAGQTIEQQIFEALIIRPADINDASDRPLIEELLETSIGIA